MYVSEIGLISLVKDFGQFCFGFFGQVSVTGVGVNILFQLVNKSLSQLYCGLLKLAFE
jgi:hypothetical protein